MISSVRGVLEALGPDFVVINVDVGDPAQVAWITVVEGPAS